MSSDDSERDSENKAYEERLRRRLTILKKAFEEGTIKIPNDSHITESLLAVRYGPDGEIDLNTVNSVVRSMALAITAMHDREELKKAYPLEEIQRIYFKFIEGIFGPHYKIMLESGLTPHDAGVALSRREEVISYVTRKIPDFLSLIEEFWRRVSEAAYAHVEDMHESLKGVFGGDLFPAHNENIASKCGIYADTIILPDPFLRSKELFFRWQKDDQAYYFIKHALNILQYKELACAELDVPIVVILPDRGVLEEGERDFYVRLGKDDAIEHAARMFGRQFESFDEMMDFAGALDTIEKVVSEIKDKTRILFGTDWEGDISEQIRQAVEGDSGNLLGTRHPGIIVASQAMGRMAVSNEILIKARRMRGTPIIDAATSWVYLTWKLEYDAGKAELGSGLKVVGTMEVTAAATGLPVWGLATIAANQVFDIPKLKDIPASIKELAQESKKLKLSPVGMLFTYASKKA